MDLLILGASARAAAHSAIRAGLSPTAIDLFADRDLAATAPVHRIAPRDYPAALESLAAGMPPGPWLYTGALENDPDLIDRIAAVRPLWGVGGETLRRVRDPIAVAGALLRKRLPTPGVSIDGAGLPRDGTWLVKPRASAGGRRIFPLRDDFAAPAWACYFQERIGGDFEGYSGLFVGRRGEAALVGMTRQWLGRPGAPFAYRGSLGPISLGWHLADQVAAIGQALADAFGLLGLFGVDLVVHDGSAYVVEVNPRYTASVEVLELALGRSLLREHGSVFFKPWPFLAASRPRPPAVVAKAVLFAEQPCRLPGLDGRRSRAGGSFAVKPLADLPAEGLLFAPGEPILTVMARGASAESCEAHIVRRLGRWRSRLVAGGP